MADGVSTQTQSRTPRRPGKGHNGAPSAADFSDIRRLRELAVLLAEDMVNIAQNSRDMKDFDAAGKQVARAYDMSGLAAKELEAEVEKLREEVAKMRGPKKSRRAMRQSDVEKKIAEAQADGVRH